MIFKAIIRRSDIGKRVHSKAKREAGYKCMMNHKNVTLGKHYKSLPETAPGGAYGYATRSAKYLKWKKKKVGHTDPNVLSGQTKRYIRANSTVTATQHKANFRASNYFPLKVQMRDELEAFSPHEEKEIAKMQADIYKKYVNEHYGETVIQRI